MKQQELKLIRFRSGRHQYAVQLSFVKEVLRMVELTSVRELPDFVVGVINLRGNVIPVIDFQMRAGLGRSVTSLKSHIMVMRIKSLLIGVLVDEVKDVLSVMDSALSRNFHPQVVVDPKYLLGSVSHEEQIVLVVNAQKLFTASEFIELDKRSVHV